jgi:hypothetical protein
VKEIQIAENRFQCRVLLNMAMNLQVKKKENVEFLGPQTCY